MLMRAMERRATQVRRYRIVVRGELDDRFSYLFGGMEMERVEGTTVLTGRVIDQTELHGFIERFEELGLELLHIEQIGEPSSAGGESGSSSP